MALSLKPIAQQVLLITGASSGIGLITARKAAAAGAKIVLVARNEEALHDIVDALRAQGHSAVYAVADVGSLDAVKDAAAIALAAFGRIDTWVNCAGVAIYAPLAETPEDEHQRLFQTNYFGVVHGAIVALEHLRERGGALITIGSIAGDIPSPIMGAYDASKHAVKGYVESLRIEVKAAALPVSITLIKPAGMSTPIAKHAANHTDGEARIPPPVYDPELVADAILEAAVYPRFSITVGGVGRLQVLVGTHFPGLLARFGGLLTPSLSDPTRFKTQTDNLSAAAKDGSERDVDELGRTFSVYGTARRHPTAVGVLATVCMALALATYRRRSRSR